MVLNIFARRLCAVAERPHAYIERLRNLIIIAHIDSGKVRLQYNCIQLFQELHFNLEHLYSSGTNPGVTSTPLWCFFAFCRAH